MCLLLKEMDLYLYSVPVDDLKDKVGILKKELLKGFTTNCEWLKSKKRDTTTPTVPMKCTIKRYKSIYKIYIIILKINFQLIWARPHSHLTPTSLE